MSEVPVPKDASTVMLIRDGEPGIEVFLQRRVLGMAFAGGMTVFPGGGVDKSDADVNLEWAGPPVAWWAQRFRTTEPIAKALVCAAVRETFEECGVLLAGPSADTVVADSAQFHTARGELERRELSLSAFLAREDLVLRTDLLRPWANWITPVGESRRYDTRFFVAVAPDGQKADDRTSEAADAVWATPAAALAEFDRKERVMMPPTWVQLDALRRYDRCADVLAVEPEIEPIQPTLRIEGASASVDVPGRGEFRIG